MLSIINFVCQLLGLHFLLIVGLAVVYSAPHDCQSMHCTIVNCPHMGNAFSSINYFIVIWRGSPSIIFIQSCLMQSMGEYQCDLAMGNVQFSTLSFLDQILKVQGILQILPKLKVSLYVHKFKVKFQHLTFVWNGAAKCGSPKLNNLILTLSKIGPNSTTPMKSVKELLTRLIEELKSTNLEDQN